MSFMQIILYIFSLPFLPYRDLKFMIIKVDYFADKSHLVPFSEVSLSG